MFDFLGGFNQTKLKTQLKMAVSRFQIASNKKKLFLWLSLFMFRLSKACIVHNDYSKKILNNLSQSKIKKIYVIRHGNYDNYVQRMTSLDRGRGIQLKRTGFQIDVDIEGVSHLLLLSTSSHDVVVSSLH